ncbi:MAG: hypothetical protein K2X87_24985, partial [Gemmataceae bacterium]|nr:hypothetical protein [Gemmataceae bacterium]
LVAGIGGPSAAVPPDLARRTVAGVNQFLTGGGASTPAAVAAKGVVGGMVKLKVSAALATAAAAMVAIGVGLADDGPRPNLPPTDPPPKGADARPLTPPAGPGVAEHRTANFVVRADHPAVARALANELEVQRREQAKAWLGKELPPWPEPCQVRVQHHESGTHHNGEMVFRRPERDDFRQVLMGDMDNLLTVYGPRAVARLLLAVHLGNEPPGWAYGVAYHMSAPTADGHLSERCFDALSKGRAFRLNALLGTPPGNESDVYEAQSHMVGKFLLARGGKPAFVRFVGVGMKDGWEKAAKDVYGFASVDALEAAWIAWMKENPPPPKDAPKPADPARIPPVKLTDTKPAAEDPPARPSVHERTNFLVSAPYDQVGGAVADAAERHRARLAQLWLGGVLPDWNTPLRITVEVTQGTPGGATTFTFGTKDGKPAVTSAEMEVHGPAKSILDSVLPHEVMHAVLATHFGKPLPRWADEGIAVTAESEAEQKSHEVKAREYLNAGRGLRLGVLFRLAEYPRDMHVLFAQGHSVVRFLLDYGGKLAQAPAGGAGRTELLEFVRIGMDGNTAESWDRAAKEVYGFASVEVLEMRWMDSLRAPPPRPAAPKPAPAEPDRIP